MFAMSFNKNVYNNLRLKTLNNYELFPKKQLHFVMKKSKLRQKTIFKN